MPRDLHCPKHFPLRYSQCHCAIPEPPKKPLPGETCKWCLSGTYGHPSCKRFGHLEMVIREWEGALAFYQKTYGVKVAEPVEPLPLGAKREITQEMRAYLASCGRKGGQSKSPAKIAASRKNVTMTKDSATAIQGSASK
jgi:hypothetical protein